MSLAVLALAPAFLTFVRSPSFEREKVQVEAGEWRLEDRSYWFKRTVIAGRSRKVTWTDTKRCPSARAVLVRVRSLEMPKADVPLLDTDEVIVTGDSVGYQLSGYAAYEGHSPSAFKIESNVGTPLAEWAEESLRALAPCWNSEPPERV